tara:strand:- start:288 stop:1436 length:1149 start_codon:yes stop_codon:yes gene_type:complete
MKITRRNFLKGSLASLFLAGSGIPVYSSTKTKKNLVVIMLRGGMDALCAVPVIGDKDFEKRRKQLILDDTIKLNSDFALHPILEGFHELWKEKKGAIIHATNIPYTQRSHFDGQNLMESGGKIPYKVKTGWLGRGMKVAALKQEGLALALPMPLILRGVPKNNNYFPTKGKLPTNKVLSLLKDVYKEKSEDELIGMLEIIKSRPKEISYAADDLYSLANEAGTLMKEPDGPRVAVFEVGGFDTHAAQGGVHGTHSDCLKDMDLIFATLKKRLKEEFENTLIVTLTEFGRTIKQNSGLGTEHGYGSAIFMGGGLLKKNQVFTDWPGLKRKQLFEQRDLNSTIDSRSIYASAMSTVFEVDFERIRKEVFWGEDLKNYSDKLFKT